MKTSEIKGRRVHFNKHWLRPTNSSLPGFRLEPMNDPLHFIILVLAIVVGGMVLLGVIGELMNLPPPLPPEFYPG